MAPVVVAVFVLASALSAAQTAGSASQVSVDYQTAVAHEIPPHRRTIPHEGVRGGFNQLRLKLVVSLRGDVLQADAGGDQDSLPFWPDLKSEVLGWEFTPFEDHGTPVIAEVEEYVDLVPPERLPTHHVVPPVLRPSSKIAISLKRSGCFGSCPSYKVTISNELIEFDGGGFVVAVEKHTAKSDSDKLRVLAKKFLDADFYSMDPQYVASVTDNPTYVLSISIDGHAKEVLDYVGSWVGMPAVITELEDEVDRIAGTTRWIKGTDGLVDALVEEKYNFKTFEAQVMLKQASQRGATQTVEDLLEAGVPLKQLPETKPRKSYEVVSLGNVGWLNAASSHPETLQVLIDAGASEKDQGDKDLALVNAARSGKVAAVKSLVDYGADPNANLSKQTVTEESGGMTLQYDGPGSALIYAAESGNPDMVREILRYHPNLDARDREGKTAMFAAGESRSDDKDGARVEIVRLLAEAGANVNARDKDGNTPLHEIYLTDVEEELLKLGADVNARNKDGDTPIFTNVDNDCVALFIEHGANLSIRNNKGDGVMDAAKEQGPLREEALRKAMENLQKPNQETTTSTTAQPGP